MNGLFSRTTWVSRYQNGKTIPARDDGVFEMAEASARPHAEADKQINTL